MLTRQTKTAPWAGLLAVLILTLCGPQLYWVLRYNWVMLQFARAALEAADVGGEVHLQAEQRQSLEAGFRQLPAAMTRAGLAQYHLGQVAVWAGDDEQAIARLAPQPGVRRAAALPVANLVLGQALWNAGREDEALAVWRVTPHMQDYFLGRAARLEYRRDYARAESDYRIAMALQSEPTAAQAGYWFARAVRLLQTAPRDPDVNPTIERAIRLNPASFPRQLRLGEALVYAQKWEQAHMVLASAIQLEPSSHWPRYYAGLVQYYQQDYTAAEQQFMETLALAPDFARGHHWLARTLVQLGQDDQALMHYREAVRLLPEDQKLAAELEALENRLKQKP